MAIVKQVKSETSKYNYIDKIYSDVKKSKIKKNKKSKKLKQITTNYYKINKKQLFLTIANYILMIVVSISIYILSIYL
ncbi:MAG: hypothetical protein N3A71_04055 [Candidatus Dojkabacteria bacterium]|nr:hypothetical protein [Candidatus Dojkabacteria bacterium]